MTYTDINTEDRLFRQPSPTIRKKVLDWEPPYMAEYKKEVAT